MSTLKGELKYEIQQGSLMDVFSIKDQYSEVVIAPELGGSILAFTSNINGCSREIFRSNLAPETVLDTCCFPLVPFSNRIRHGQFTWQNKNIQLPLNALPEVHAHHGHGWQTTWKIDEVSASSIVISYQYKPDQWPFAYSTTQKISLDNGMLVMSLALTNNSKTDMPAGLGFHPYFTRTPQSALASDISQVWQVDEQCLPTEISAAPAALAEPQGMVFEGSNLDNALVDFPHQASVIWPEWQAKAEITTSDNCDFLVVYSPDNANFSCVEPVTHITDAINMAAKGVENTGEQTLKPDESLTIWMKVKPSAI